MTIFFFPPNLLLIMSKQSPVVHTIFLSTPYILALCFAHFIVLGSFSMAKTCSHLSERAKAMEFPPTPANASIMTVLSLGVDSAICAAILLQFVRINQRTSDTEMTYFAIGSGVTPNQASSVIQMPSWYFCHILKRWCQYLRYV